MQLKRHARRMKGFTIIELVITIAVFAILIALGLPSFSDWIHNSQIRNAAESILDGLQNARALAVKRNGYVQFLLTDPAGANPTGWQVIAINPPLGGANPACQAETVDPLTGNVVDPVLMNRAAQEGSSSATLTISPAGLTAVPFGPLGWVTIDCGGPIAAVDPNSSVTFDVGSSTLDVAAARPLRILVRPNGGIRLCDPQLAAGDPRACN